MNRVAVAAGFLWATLASAQPGQPFEFNFEGPRAQIWGAGSSIPRIYFPENLPSLFTRTLELKSALPPGGTIEWIFTGDEGGVTVQISGRGLRVVQRYYDSFGLSQVRPPKARYPESVWDETKISHSGEVRTVGVALDHRLSLVVLLNGKQVVRQTCLLEVRRHQLAWRSEAPPSGRLSGTMIQPPEEEATVRMRSEERHQSVLGFGGIVSPPAYAQLSEEGKQRWWDLLLAYNLLLHREYPNGTRLLADLSNFDRLADATPHYYGDNFPNGEISDFAYIAKLRRLGGRVLFEFWDLPPWAKRDYRDAEGKTHPRAPKIPEYVRAMVGYCRISKEKAGAPPDIVGIQNEIIQPAEVWHEMILKLREGLDQSGFHSVKIHMPDPGALDGGIRAARAIRKLPAAWKAIDFAATHVYDFQRFFEEPDGYDARIAEWNQAVEEKPFLSTEFTVNNSAYQSASYRTAFAQAQLYHKNLALMNARALLYCWLLLDIEQRSFGATRSLFVPDRAHGSVPVPSGYQLRVFGAYSRRLREGMVRVGAASSRPDLLVTAFEGSAGRRTVVFVNRSTATQRVKIEWPGPGFRYLERVSQYEENAVVTPARQPLAIQPGEIVTLSTVPLRRPVR